MATHHLRASRCGCGGGLGGGQCLPCLLERPDEGVARAVRLEALQRWVWQRAASHTAEAQIKGCGEKESLCWFGVAVGLCWVGWAVGWVLT